MQATEWTPGQIAVEFYRLIYKVCADYVQRHPIRGMDASDLAQNAVLSLYRKWGGGVPDGVPVRAFVIVRTRQACATALRDQFWQCRDTRREKGLGLMWRVLDSDTRRPDRIVSDRERLQELRGAAKLGRIAPRDPGEFSDLTGVDVIGHAVSANTVNTENDKRNRQAYKAGQPTYRLTCWRAGQWVEIDEPVTAPPPRPEPAPLPPRIASSNPMAFSWEGYKEAQRVRKINEENRRRRKTAEKNGDPSYWIASADGSGKLVDLVEVPAPPAAA